MTDWFDSEPLGWAASFGQCKAIEALCAAGADPRRPANLAHQTPLSDAQREGHEKAIRLINEYLAGARSMGEKPAAPVAHAALVESPTGADTAASAIPVGVAVTKPPMVDMVELIKRELGLSGEMHEVIATACEQLHVSPQGKSMLDQGYECWSLLSGKQ